METTYQTPDWDTYKMEYASPHRALESPEAEIAVVDAALGVLCDAGVLPHQQYDHDKMLAHRRAVAERFEIPWTAISPRVQRLIYAINAIARPRHMIAAGVFCGNTFISNAGAAVGPGACYQAETLLGVEILPEEARRAERNVSRIDPTGVAKVVTGDAIQVVAAFNQPIHLLYLDASGAGDQGKRLYLDILQAGYDRMPAGSLVLAHNSVNCAEQLAEYLAYVRGPTAFRASVNVILDPEGLEVSVK